VQIVLNILSQKYPTQTGFKALSSNPSTTKRKIEIPKKSTRMKYSKRKQKTAINL
jgi:hypothetical protein